MGNDMIVWVIVLSSLVLAAIGTAVFRNLLLASVTLALTSAILTVALFMMGMHLAAVMELSVCAGLVTAVFASAISLTRPTHSTTPKKKRMRYLPLPFILLALAAGILLLWPGLDIQIVGAQFTGISSQQVLWDQRFLDIVGLGLIILAGVLGVAVLFKEKEGQ